MKPIYLVLILAVIIGIMLVSGSLLWITDWIWLSQIGFSAILIKSIEYKLAAGIAVAIITFFLSYLNLSLLKRVFRRLHVVDIEFNGTVKPEQWLSVAVFLVSGFLAVVYGLAASNRWVEILRSLNSTAFGVNDPLYGRDVSFYVFKLPFLHSIYSYAMSLTVVLAIICGIVYVLSGSLSFVDRKIKINPQALGHIALLVALGFVIKAFGYKLDSYQLVYSSRGLVYGAGYTDVHVIKLGLTILMAVSVIAAIGVLIDSMTKRLRFLIPAIVGLVVVSLFFNGVVPGLVERFQVKPNQADLESPYIANHIEMTRKAYNLDNVDEVSFAAEENLTAADIDKNKDIISNIRLWDWRPLLDIYSQTQSSKAYYEFDEVDVDRYTIDGSYRQVMLSGREMNPSRIPGSTSNWINSHLVYTHGYGLAMSYANEISNEGFPVYAVENIPPVSAAGLDVTTPQIYYGEKTNDYAIANNNYRGVGEFDYPAGDQNVYIKYDGTGGIPLSSFFVKTLFALRFGQANIFLSDAITNDSRLMVYRNVMDRINRIAPFFQYDGDPYMVLVGGRLYWVIDAYTTTDKYPYSQPVIGWGDTRGYGGTIVNYVRNSVKVVVDAYNGDVNFYRWDDNDPMAKVYDKIFPSLFTDKDQLSDEMISHFRYPEDIFTIQSQIFSTYHMEDVSVFFNKEDQWRIPPEQYQSGQVQMRPYYIITRLPDKTDSEFVMMVPYSPIGKYNMTALFVVSCDAPNYGQLTLYKLPKEKTIKGPMQIENLIDGDDQISKDLTLWNQQGSRVIRGNLLVVPIEKSLLYVEPIFLEPEGNPFPVLKRVVASYAGKVVAEKDLTTSLSLLFQGYAKGAVTEQPDTTPSAQQPKGTVTDTSLADKALQLFNEAKNAVRDNDWATYGDKLSQLEEILSNLVGENTNQ